MVNESIQAKLSPHLLYFNKEFDSTQSPPPNSNEIIEDLGLNVIFESMARGDKKVKEVSEKVVLDSMTEVAEIKYRQEVIRDALRNKSTVRDIFSILTVATERARKDLFWFSRSNTEFSLHQSVSIMEFYVSVLEGLREVAETHLNNFESEGFRNLFNQFADQFNYRFVAIVREHLRRLKFPNGVKVIGRLGKGCEPTDFRLVRPDLSRGIGSRVVNFRDRRYTYVLPERDESGYQELENMRNKGLSSVTTALVNAADNLLNFINTLTTELAFLVGCINLYEDIEKMKGGTVFPNPKLLGNSTLFFTGLYDVSLFIRLKGAVVPNDIASGNQRLIIITGANRGGKSTLLRSIGQSLLMMQAGMFVGGKEFTASTFYGVYTHFKKEEEKEMTMGKFDEELERMSRIVDQLRRGGLVLFNESFAATNAVEGSQIAVQIINGLIESGMTVIFVTHLYELAELFLKRPSAMVRFLVAERLENGERTYRVISGIPTSTSYGDDLYRKIFGSEA